MSVRVDNHQALNARSRLFFLLSSGRLFGLGRRGRYKKHKEQHRFYQRVQRAARHELIPPVTLSPVDDPPEAQAAKIHSIGIEYWQARRKP